MVVLKYSKPFKIAFKNYLLIDMAWNFLPRDKFEVKLTGNPKKAFFYYFSINKTYIISFTFKNYN